MPFSNIRLTTVSIFKIELNNKYWRLCCVQKQHNRLLHLPFCKGGDSNVLIAVIPFIWLAKIIHSMPPWHVELTPAWWHAKKEAKMNYPQEKDELKARFTVWLEKLIYRVRLKYLKKLDKQINAISIEEISKSTLLWSDSKIVKDNHCFDFEEEKLSKAFCNLPIKRQQILEMLFVECMKPKEIAKELNCSIQHVYNQRSLAVQKLRSELICYEGDNNEKK